MFYRSNHGDPGPFRPQRAVTEGFCVGAGAGSSDERVPGLEATVPGYSAGTQPAKVRKQNTTDSRRWSSAAVMLGQRRRRWPNITAALGQRLVPGRSALSFLH